MTEIVYRNFIRLLGEGSFRTEESLEMMSAFKWMQVLRLAKACGVVDLVSTGMVAHGAARGSVIPPAVVDVARGHAIAGGASPFPRKGYDYFAHAKPGNFANFLTNRKLGRITRNELRGIDTSMPSLEFLYRMVEGMNGFLVSGQSFRGVVAIGEYLRSDGDKVDFIKVRKWIRSLGMDRMASFTCSHLVDMFGFAPDEMPFVERIDRGLQERSWRHLRKTAVASPTKAGETGEIGSESIRTLIGSISKPSTAVFRYFVYCPVEAFSRILANIAKSLSNIEE